jgi:opacity protein-like surface antigen
MKNSLSQNLVKMILVAAVASATSVVGVSSASAAAGNEVGILFGIRSAEFSTDATIEPDYKSSLGFAAGVIAIGEMGGMKFRTGGYYATRGTEIEIAGVKADLEVASLDVPVTVLYDLNDMVSFFGGALFAVRISDDCSGDAAICDSDIIDELSSFYTAATIGMHAQFHPNWSGEISYEYGLSDVTEDTGMNTLAVSAIFAY